MEPQVKLEIEMLHEEIKRVENYARKCVKQLTDTIFFMNRSIRHLTSTPTKLSNKSSSKIKKGLKS